MDITLQPLIDYPAQEEYIDSLTISNNTSIIQNNFSLLSARVLSDSEVTVLGDTSGMNTGDETKATIISKIGAFNGISEIVQTDANGYLPTLDKRNLIGVYSQVACTDQSISITITTAGTFYSVTSSLIAQNTITGFSNNGFTWLNGVGTCTIAGNYQMSLDIALKCATATQLVKAAIYKNSAALATGHTSCYTSSTVSQNIALSSTSIGALAAGDTVSIGITNATATNALIVTDMNLVLVKL
jgi:hypothetical protein